MSTETDLKLVEIIDALWKQVSPSYEAQAIRASIPLDSGAFDDSDGAYVADYVWPLVDIAIELALQYARDPSTEPATDHDDPPSSVRFDLAKFRAMVDLSKSEG